MEKFSAQDLLNDSAKLQAYEHYCAGCPANVLHEPFGCYGSLAYPIPASVEQWLMARLPDNLQSTAGWFLQKAIADFRYNGGSIRDMRRHDMFFDRRKPVRRVWRMGVLRRWTLTSDQLLEMIIGLGNVQSAHCGMVALFLGVVSHETPIEQVRNHAAWREVFGRARVDTNEGDPAIRRWAFFLNALAAAVVLDVRLVVDG